MTIRATADSKYIRKYIFLALAGLGFFLWGAYDAVYKFPAELEMAREFDKIKDEKDAVHLWAQLYEENKDRGWHREKPHNAAETVEGYIRFNLFIIVAGAMLMSYFLLKYFRTKGSWIESTETGINTSWGESLEIDKISKINKRRWEAKGIAKISYQDAKERNRTMVFDDFKFDREPMGELMALCEQNLSADQIVGGKSQALIATEAATKAAEEANDEWGESDADE